MCYIIFQEMEERHRDVLQKCSEYLIKNIRPELLVDKLHSDGILSNDDVERLRKEATTDDKNRLLLARMIPRSGPKAFSSLVTALKESEPKQSHVADYLMAHLRKGKSVIYTRCEDMPWPYVCVCLSVTSRCSTKTAR